MGDCLIRNCCMKKGLRFCHECGSFPCVTLTEYPKRIEELNDIKEVGSENWIKKKLQ